MGPRSTSNMGARTRKWEGRGQRADGREERERELQAQESAMRRFFRGRERESITGAPRPQAGLGQETVGESCGTYQGWKQGVRIRMRAQGTVICALWVPQKRRAAEWCRVQSADSTPRWCRQRTSTVAVLALQLQQSGKNRGSCPVPGQVLKCSCKGTERSVLELWVSGSGGTNTTVSCGTVLAVRELEGNRAHAAMYHNMI